MNIDTQFYLRCILTLEKAYSLLIQSEKESLEYEMYRSACIKEFEIILEQSGKLLKKALKPYFHSAKAVDKLVFNDLFRHAAQYDPEFNFEVRHSLISSSHCQFFENNDWLLKSQTFFRTTVNP